MRWIVSLLVIAAMLTFGSVAVAQGETGRPVGANPVGEAIIVYSAEGEEAAQFTVTEVVDDFDDYAEYYDPQRGERYVFVVIEIEVTGERPFEFQPYDLSLLDAFGRQYSQGYAERSDQSTVEIPDLEEANMLPGEEVTGGLIFTVPADAEVVQVVYQFYSDMQQLYLLADLSSGSSGETSTPSSD